MFDFSWCSFLRVVEETRYVQEHSAGPDSVLLRWGQAGKMDSDDSGAQPMSHPFCHAEDADTQIGNDFLIHQSRVPAGRMRLGVSFHPVGHLLPREGSSSRRGHGGLAWRRVGCLGEIWCFRLIVRINMRTEISGSCMLLP